MCRTEKDPDGPRSCSGDKRQAYAEQREAVSALTDAYDATTKLLTSPGASADVLMEAAAKLRQEARMAEGWGGPTSGNAVAAALASSGEVMRKEGRAAALTHAKKGLATAKDQADSRDWGGDARGAAYFRAEARGYQQVHDYLTGVSDSLVAAESSSSATKRPLQTDTKPEMSTTKHVAGRLARASDERLVEARTALSADALGDGGAQHLSMLLSRVSKEQGRSECLAKFAQADANHHTDVDERNRAVLSTFDQHVGEIESYTAAQ